MNRAALKRLLRSRAGQIGLAVLAAHLAIALLAPLLAPHSTTDIDPFNAFARPGAGHLFGTDQFGRDIFSRVLHGGRAAIVVAVVTTSVGVLLGSLLGMYVSVTRGVVDEIVVRVSDAIFAIPSLLLLLLIMTLFGGGLGAIVVVLSALKIAPVTRVIRAQSLELVGRDFIVAAKLRGESNAAIIRRELLPHAIDVMLVEFAMRCSWTVMAMAGLSFLGFGVRPPTADWGLMVAENRSMLQIAPWGSLFPIAAIASLVIGLNLAADALAKALGIDRTKEVPV